MHAQEHAQEEEKKNVYRCLVHPYNTISWSFDEEKSHGECDSENLQGFVENGTQTIAANRQATLIGAMTLSFHSISSR